MIDPLNDFDWPSLYRRYDARCGGFDQSVAQLAVFEPRPPSYRHLYYRLIDSFRPEPGQFLTVSVKFYEAMLYWKLYSSRGGDNLIPSDSEKRENISKQLDALVDYLSKNVERDENRIVQAVEKISEYSNNRKLRRTIPGMKGNEQAPALPVRTTFLHFLFPDIVPIFDKMVLRAVGIRDENANQDVEVLRRYIPFVWDLAKQYHDHFAGFCETPVRLVEMALWVTRG